MGNTRLCTHGRPEAGPEGYSRAGTLRSATEPIDDTSTGKLMEGVLAAFAQFDSDCRSDRTRAGIKAALEVAESASTSSR
ncbi:MAG: recombinase family protein [Vicinamibacterales bacterium]